jgi:hypothetical protein
MSDLSAIRALNFLGRKEEWPTSTEKFLANIKTKQIIRSRDLVWLNLSYGNWNKSKSNSIQPQDNEDTSDTEVMTEDASDLAETEDATLKKAHIRKQNKALKQISKLKSWFNPDPSKLLGMQNLGREMIVETADFARSCKGPRKV